MNRNSLVLIPFIIGIILLSYGWYLSYPLSIESSNDYVFNHISIFYWISLPLLLPSMFLMAITSKNKTAKWLLSIGIFFVVNSLSFFYYTLPGADSQYFRGLNENFIHTNNLNSSTTNLMYYQWPIFFLLAQTTTSLTTLDLTQYAFLIYAVIGFLITTVVYIYASKIFENGGPWATTAFTFLAFYILNYQAAPFSLAFALLLVLFIVELRPHTNTSTVITIFLFTSICIAHAFVAVFFVLYCLIFSILNRSGYHLKLFFLTSALFVLTQLIFAKSTFLFNLNLMLNFSSEYKSMIQNTFVPRYIPLDILAQWFSRVTVVIFAAVCAIGFLLYFIRKRIRRIDIAVFLTGALYSVVGFAIYTLGSRAIPLALIALCPGIAYLARAKLKPYLAGLFAVLLVFAVFIPIHSSFTNNPITFQSQQELLQEKFLIEKYSWNTYSMMLTDVGTEWYLFPQVGGNVDIVGDFSPAFQNNSLLSYDCIVYSVGLEINLQAKNASSVSDIQNNFDIVYNSGPYWVAIK